MPLVVRYTVQSLFKRCKLQQLRIDQDIKPLSEVRNGMATYTKQILILIIRHRKQILPIDEIKT